MATITIQDDILQKLKEKASARKLSLDAYLNDVAASDAATPSDSARQLAAIESFITGTTAWSAEHLPPGHLVDDSRESIYEGRGE
jgi:hypothetical protein